MKNLRNKNCVLTGAASGIGRSLALELAKEGMHLFLVDLDESGLDEIKKEVEQFGNKVFTAKCDVANYTEVQDLAKEVYLKLGDVDLLINNAGIAGAGVIEDMSLDEWKRVIDVNLWSVIYSITEFLPKMLEKGSGHIVNTASGAGIVGLPLHPHYVASKAAVVGITEALNGELSGRGLKFSAICPTQIKTNIIDRTVVKVPYHLIEGNPEEIDEKLDAIKRGFWEEYMRDAKTPEQVVKRYLKGIKKERLYVLDSRILRLAMFIKAISQGLYNRILRGQGKDKLERMETALSKLGLKLKPMQVKLKKNRKKLRDKRCVLTGAGSGIGRALAFELAKRGVHLFLADLNLDRIDELKSELAPFGINIFTKKCDVSNYADFQQLADEAYSKFGGEIDILINNAGIGGGGYAEDMTLEEWKRVIDVNLWSIIYAVSIFIPRFLERGEGYFVSTGSGAGVIGLPYHIEYVASKFAVVGLSEALYSELSLRGIDVSVICPSFIKTNIMERSEVMLPQKLIAGISEKELGEKLAVFKQEFEKYYFENGSTPEEVAKKYIKGIEKRQLYIFDTFLIPFARFVKAISEGLYKRILGRVHRQDLEVIEKALKEAGIESGDLIY